MTDNNQNDNRSRRLLAIRRSRNNLFVCFLTFPVYVLAVTQVLQAGNDTSVIMFAYMALYAWFGVRVVVQRCPDCHQQYFVKSFFLNPFTSKCAHCGLPLHQHE